jgi:hypothetical protein
VDPEALYIQLGRLIEAMPDLLLPRLPQSTYQWLGKAHALVTAGGNVADAIKLTLATDNLGTEYAKYGAAQEIQAVIYRALAKAELSAPASAQGAFLPAGNAFDALAAIGKVLLAAKGALLIVDPYMDEKTLTDFAVLAAENVTLNLLADRKTVKPGLKPAAAAWVKQYGSRRPLEVRTAPAGTLHDRLIVVDANQVWVLTQSFNAFAARAPATIVRTDDETAALKVAAYEAIWRAATPI